MLKVTILLLITFSAQALKLFPIPLDKQFNEADGVIYGEFLGTTYKKMHDDKVVTEASFKIIKSAGISSRYMINKNLFRVYFDGGIWQNLQHYNESAPSFKDNKSYVLLIKKDNFGFRPYRDKLGVYDVVENREGKKLVSQAFPMHPKIGQFNFSNFDLGIKSVFGEYLHEFHSDKFVNTSKKFSTRAPASVQDTVEDVQESKIGIMWVTMTFGLLGAMRMRRLRRKKFKSSHI